MYNYALDFATNRRAFIREVNALTGYAPSTIHARMTVEQKRNRGKFATGTEYKFAAKRATVVATRKGNA